MVIVTVLINAKGCSLVHIKLDFLLLLIRLFQWTLTRL